MLTCSNLSGIVKKFSSRGLVGTSVLFRAENEVTTMGFVNRIRECDARHCLNKLPSNGSDSATMN